jgi:hypothetical protein
VSAPVPSPETRAAIPYARSIVALDPEHFAAIRRAVALLFRIAHSPEYLARVDRDAPECARFDPGNFGVLMGYDFHLTAAGPRLIEINTNAGGALLNGLHTAAACDRGRLACLCDEVLPVESIEERLVRTFRAEVEAARGPGAALRRLAIADERPREQFLYPEFELFQALFARAGIEAVVVDTADLARVLDGRIHAGGAPVDLVYLRDTDFLLEAPRNAGLRAAYLARDVVVSPAPREHWLLANKRRLAIFSSRDALAELGVGADDAGFLGALVPETRSLAELGLERAWESRREWVFKPAAAFGGRAVYRGDKVSRRKLSEIACDPMFLAQRRVEPGELEVATSEGPRRMKFDVRAYAYRDEVLLLGARAYEGQVTNLRSPGGGFSAICVVRAGSPELTAS